MKWRAVSYERDLEVEDLRERRHKLRGGSSGVTLRVRTLGGALHSPLRGIPSPPAGPS